MEKLRELIKIFIAQIWGSGLFVCVELINKSLRIQIENKTGKQLFGEDQLIFAIWHKNTFTPFYLYRGKNIAMFVSNNIKGQVLENAATKLGYDVIPLERLLVKSTIKIRNKLLTKQNIIMAVDGPVGPAMHIKEGCQYLTEKTDVPTVAVNVNYKLYFPIFWRWDKYRIPFPFSKVIITFSPLFKNDSEWDNLAEHLGE